MRKTFGIVKLYQKPNRLGRCVYGPPWLSCVWMVVLSDTLDDEDRNFLFDGFGNVAENRVFVFRPVAFVQGVGAIEPVEPFRLIFGAIAVGGFTAGGGFGAKRGGFVDSGGFDGKIDVHDLSARAG